jgi:hypothetical protein
MDWRGSFSSLFQPFRRGEQRHDRERSIASACSSSARSSTRTAAGWPYTPALGKGTTFHIDLTRP